MHASNAMLVDLLRNVPGERLAPLFERHDIPAARGVESLVNELCLDGANTFASILRGWEGVSYAEIVRDVAGKMKVPVSDSEGEPQVELKLIEELIRRYLQDATPEDRERVEEVIRQAGSDFTELGKQIASGSLRVGSLGLLIKSVGQRMVAELVKKLMLRMVSRQAAKEAAKQAARVVGYAMPVINVLMLGWTIIDIGGPAFRKTLPSVLEIALLRMEFSPQEA